MKKLRVAEAVWRMATNAVDAPVVPEVVIEQVYLMNDEVLIVGFVVAVKLLQTPFEPPPVSSVGPFSFR